MKKGNEIEALLKTVSPKNRYAFENWLYEFRCKFHLEHIETNNCSFDCEGWRTKYLELEPADGMKTSSRYEMVSNDLQEVAESYVKNPKIQNNFIDCLLLQTYLFLCMGALRQTYGYRIEHPVSGWRTNMFVHITKLDINNPVPFILGFLSSGYFLYPLILYITGMSYTWLNITIGILLGLKVIETLWAFISFLFRIIKGKKLPMIEVMNTYGQIYDYMVSNHIIQPIKIRKWLEKLDGLITPPTYVSIIVDRMIKKDPNYFETMADIIRREHQLCVKPNPDKDDAILFGYQLKTLKVP